MWSRLYVSDWGTYPHHKTPSDTSGKVLDGFHSCQHLVMLSCVRHHYPGAIFLYCVLRGLNINIGQVIADEIQSCACGASNKVPLGHPSLITHLCEIAGIDVFRPPLERPRKELDTAYFTHYCVVDDEPGHPVSLPQQPRVHARAPPLAQEPVHEAAPFRSQKGGRAEAVEASAMDEDAEDEDEEVEEEEDSDDDE
ncbi:hypothetical protein LR48_Vigan02g084700 [Vigna angularis]|uniref:Putative plant transposon protein domain-containing protein n=1 Tax=Phaseolus angularis TaxID=3914 RepID=A0A0L9TWA7_PHAAN|nr:hypothetical protein LR48_Vigan02g084700 [Vigna angularis]